jgi:acetoin utilization deacetylase AcuC-like enzyme
MDTYGVKKILVCDLDVHQGNGNDDTFTRYANTNIVCHFTHLVTPYATHCYDTSPCV